MGVVERRDLHAVPIEYHAVVERVGLDGERPAVFILEKTGHTLPPLKTRDEDVDRPAGEPLSCLL